MISGISSYRPTNINHIYNMMRVSKEMQAESLKRSELIEFFHKKHLKEIQKEMAYLTGLLNDLGIYNLDSRYMSIIKNKELYKVRALVTSYLSNIFGEQVYKSLEPNHNFKYSEQMRVRELFLFQLRQMNRTQIPSNDISNLITNIANRVSLSIAVKLDNIEIELFNNLNKFRPISLLNMSDDDDDDGVDLFEGFDLDDDFEIFELDDDGFELDDSFEFLGIDIPNLNIPNIKIDFDIDDFLDIEYKNEKLKIPSFLLDIVKDSYFEKLNKTSNSFKLDVLGYHLKSVDFLSESKRLDCCDEIHKKNTLYAVLENEKREEKLYCLAYLEKKLNQVTSFIESHEKEKRLNNIIEESSKILNNEIVDINRFRVESQIQKVNDVQKNSVDNISNKKIITNMHVDNKSNLNYDKKIEDDLKYLSELFLIDLKEDIEREKLLEYLKSIEKIMNDKSYLNVLYQRIQNQNLLGGVLV